MSDLAQRVGMIEHTVKEQHYKITDLSAEHDRLEKASFVLENKLASVKGDVRAYTIQHGESIKTLQEAVHALRDLTAELKQESKLQEKSIEAVIKQMQAMNSSIVDMSKTINKFLYIGSGILVALTLISNGTITKFLSTIGGAG